MTTYVICDNSECKHKFISPIQVGNLETNVVEGNEVKCPHCKLIFLAENRNMVNE